MVHAQFWRIGAVLVALLPAALSALSSPCPNVFKYAREDGNIVGKIELSNMGFGEHLIKAVLSLKADRPVKSYGELVREDEDEQNNNKIVYTVHFPIQSSIPKVVSITYDSVSLCSGERETFSGGGKKEYISTIRLEASLSITKGTLNTGTTTTSKPRHTITKSQNHQIITNRYQMDNYKPTSQQASGTNKKFPCGVPSDLSAGFVKYGQTTSRGEWPWLVTVNLRRDKEYLCTGVLVSTNVVISAAHCVFAGTTEKSPKQMLLEFGIYDRINDKNRVTRNVKKIELPGGHRPTNPPTHDLAALVLEEPVAYTDFIIPVCLWSGDRGLKRIIDNQERGSVIGWGMDEKDNDATPDPRLIQLPIVQFNKCTRSHKSFANIIKGRQFCAGTADGKSGVCNGDSGAGMYFYKDEQRRWELKGIVSFGVNSAKHTCDLDRYVVLTDVSHPEYTKWINDIIDDEMLPEPEEDY